MSIAQITSDLSLFTQTCSLSARYREALGSFEAIVWEVDRYLHQTSPPEASLSQTKSSISRKSRCPIRRSPLQVEGRGLLLLLLLLLFVVVERCCCTLLLCIVVRCCCTYVVSVFVFSCQLFLMIEVRKCSSITGHVCPSVQ